MSDDGWVSLAVVNVSEDKSTRTSIEGVKGPVTVFSVTGSGVGVVNTEAKQEVGITESAWDGEGLFEFQKHSLTMLRWKA